MCIGMMLFWLTLILSPLVLPFSRALEARRQNRVRAAAVMALGNQLVPESIGAVAAAYNDAMGRLSTVANRPLREAAARAMPALLVTLTPDHYGRLDAQAVPNLCRALEWTDRQGTASAEEELLTLHLLEALGKVGDGRAVASVQRVAEESHSPNCRTLAERILPVLKERQLRENESQMLLRGTLVPVAGTDVLLRPASAAAETEPKQLLRASLIGDKEKRETQ